MKTLCVFTNSPGEISYWVKPLLTALSKIYPDAVADIFLTPCPYASGQEREVLSALSNVRGVYDFSFKKRFNYDKESTVVFFLGGDPFYSLFFAFRHGLKRYAYSEGRRLRFFNRVFYRQDGDLMSSALCPVKDASVLKRELGLTAEKYCVFLPGSRPRMIKRGVPYYSDIVRCIQAQHPEFKALLLVSPFITEEALSRYDVSLFDVVKNVDERYIALGELLVTFPGSATAAAMYMQQPMLMLLPLQFSDAMTFTGLLSLLVRLPLLRPLIGWILPKLGRLNKKGYALPNIISGRRLVPEITGNIPVEQAASAIMDIFYNDERLHRQKVVLSELQPQVNVAERIMLSLSRFPKTRPPKSP